MGITEFTGSTPATTGGKLLILAQAGFARLAATWRSVRNRRSVASLLEWDDRMLGDIGLTAGDVRSALASPLGDDPSYRLGVMSVERRAAFRATAQEARREAMRAQQMRTSVRSKSETLAGAHTSTRRVPPHRTLEL